MESIGLIGFVFIAFLVVLWTLLPFAVFGIKARLDKQNNLLNEVIQELRKLNAK